MPTTQALESAKTHLPRLPTIYCTKTACWLKRNLWKVKAIEFRLIHNLNFFEFDFEFAEIFDFFSAECETPRNRKILAGGLFKHCFCVGRINFTRKQFLKSVSFYGLASAHNFLTWFCIVGVDATEQDSAELSDWNSNSNNFFGHDTRVHKGLIHEKNEKRPKVSY